MKTTKRKKKPVRAARSAKRRTAAAPAGLLFPGTVIPLQAYGAWKANDWALMDGKRVWFNMDNGHVKMHARDRQHAYYDQDLGPLPDGWDCASIHHVESKVDEYFVGPAAIIAKLKRLEETREGNDAAIGRIIHANG